MNNGGRYHFGIIGSGNDIQVAAYGGSMLIQPDDYNAPKAWTCAVCTFHNTETLGRFCSMCGNARMGNGESSQGCHEGDCKPQSNGSGVGKNRRGHFDDFDDGPAYTLSPDSQHRSLSLPMQQFEQSSPPPPPIADEDDYQYPRAALTPRSRRGYSGGATYGTSYGRRTPKPSRRGRDLEGSLHDVPETSESVAYAPPSQHLHESFDFCGDDSWTRGNQSTRRGKSLEGSFSVLNLLREDIDEQGSPDARKPAAKLCDKDFMMSFANWSVSDQGVWTCVACTYLNTNPLHLTCEICGQKRPNGKDAANECQKAMQAAFETSIRTGQDDFIKRQQEKIEEVEERVLAAERVDEILEIQQELMEEFNMCDGTQNGDNGYVHQYQQERATLAQDFISQLEDVRKQEREEQQRVEKALEYRRRELNLKQPPYYSFESHPSLAAQPPQPLPPPESTQNPVELEVRAQEQMLSRWKQQYSSRAVDIEKIRIQQQEIHERLNGGYHS